MSDANDPFEGLRLDEDFVKGGLPEPATRFHPSHTRRPMERPGRVPTPSIPKRQVPTVLGVSWVFLVLIAVCAGTAYASWRFGGSHVAVFGFVISGWLLSLSLHEFSHAAVAFIGGDRSVSAKGYLTLDVRRYVHPVLSFLLPVLFVILGGIGLPGGAVWIDQASLRSRGWRSATSLAGPFANILCAFACLLPFALLPSARLLAGPHLEFWAGLAFLGFLQLWSVLLNLLPLPGLDGWGALEPHLPAHVVMSARRVQPFVFLIIFFVVFSSPTVGGHLRSFLDSVEGRFHVPTGLPEYGYYLMKFWQS